MDPDRNEARAVWTAPKLIELNLGMQDIAFGIGIGTDGDDPGPPDTSDS